MNTAEVIPMHSKSEERQTPNPAWAFNLDPVHSWAYWDKAFTDEECDKIIALGNDRTQRQATTRGGDKDEVRKSEVAWLYPSDDLDWELNRNRPAVALRLRDDECHRNQVKARLNSSLPAVVGSAT